MTYTNSFGEPHALPPAALTATALLPLAMAWLVNASVKPKLPLTPETAAIKGAPEMAATCNMLAPLCKYIERTTDALQYYEAAPQTWYDLNKLAQAVLDAMQAAAPDMYARMLADVEAGR
jgi:hypothetical protein